jgi:hypothetical protein
MLNEVKCAKIFWHSIQERSSRCLSSDASSVGDKYPTMTAKPAVKASVIKRLALSFVEPVNTLAGSHTQTIPPPPTRGLREVRIVD